MQSAGLSALTLASAELAEFTSWSMRVESVRYSVLATVSVAWQPLDTHERKVFPVMSHDCAVVGTPLASTHGAAMNRWPVLWKTNLPVAGSVAVLRAT